MTEKQCRTCCRWLPATEFYAHRVMCKACVAFVQANWYAQNKVRLRPIRRDYQRTWRRNNPGQRGRKRQEPRTRAQANAYKREYRQRDYVKAQQNDYNRRYYAAHRAEILQQKKRAKLARAMTTGLDSLPKGKD